MNQEEKYNIIHKIIGDLQKLSLFRNQPELREFIDVQHIGNIIGNSVSNLLKDDLAEDFINGVKSGIKYKNDKIIFDVGANDLRNVQNYINKEGYTIYAFEPLEEFNSIYDLTSNVIYFNVLIGNTQEYQTLNINNIKGCSSVLELHENYKENYVSKNWDNFKVIDQKYMLMTRLSNFIDIFNIEKIHFLNIDTQGYDLEVLKGMGKSINIIEKGCIEATKKPLYKGQPLIDETINFLESVNFEITKVEDSYHGIEYNIFFKNTNN